MHDKQRLAIIGGGLSGVTTAQQLQDKFDITIFEKARGLGGRMSTRRADPFQFDHGAQYFTVRSEEFQSFLKRYIHSGLVREWHPKIVHFENGVFSQEEKSSEPYYICAPRMNSLCKELSQDFDKQISVKIERLVHGDDGWTLIDQDENGCGPFDWVISTVPSHQAQDLLPKDFKGLDEIRAVKMTGCFSVMLGFEKLPSLEWGVLKPKKSLIGWAAINSLKPDRDTALSILIQTTNEWAEDHIEEKTVDVEEFVIKEFCNISGIDASTIVHRQCHRWRYANTNIPANQSYYIDEKLKIGVCGDWCIKGRVESAFLSAYKLSQYIM